MYYATELFVKKGALGKIWLAGTLFKKLSKKAILESDIQDLCYQVRDPPLPLAISTCGRLTLGIVRIHDKILQYLLIEATEAQAKLARIIIRSQIDLPQNRLRARPDQIDMAEEKMEDLEDLRLDQSLLLTEDERKAEVLLARPEDITLEEEFQSIFLEREEARNEPLDLDISFPTIEKEIELDLTAIDRRSLDVEEITEHERVSLHSGATAGKLRLQTPEMETIPRISIEARPRHPPTPPSPTPEYARKGGKKLRFSRDSKIELPPDELQFRSQDLPNVTVQRPFWRTLSERPLGEGDWEKLMTAPLGDYLGSQQQKYFQSSLDNLLIAEGLTEREMEEEEEEKRETIPSREIPRSSETGLRRTPAMTNISSPIVFDQEVVQEEPLLEPLRRRKASRTSTERDAEFDIELEEFPAAIVPSSVQSDLIASSEEATPPSTLSTLSKIFHNLIASKMDKLEEQEEELKINLEELLEESANTNEVLLTRRDVALGFLQTLILKAADVISLEQEQPNSPVWITKGPEFESLLN